MLQQQFMDHTFRLYLDRKCHFTRIYWPFFRWGIWNEKRRIQQYSSYFRLIAWKIMEKTKHSMSVHCIHQKFNKLNKAISKKSLGKKVFIFFHQSFIFLTSLGKQTQQFSCRWTQAITVMLNVKGPYRVQCEDSLELNVTSLCSWKDMEIKKGQ